MKIYQSNIEYIFFKDLLTFLTERKSELKDVILFRKNTLTYVNLMGFLGELNRSVTKRILRLVLEKGQDLKQISRSYIKFSIYKSVMQ